MSGFLAVHRLIWSYISRTDAEASCKKEALLAYIGMMERTNFGSMY